MAERPKVAPPPNEKGNTSKIAKDQSRNAQLDVKSREGADFKMTFNPMNEN